MAVTLWWGGDVTTELGAVRGRMGRERVGVGRGTR